MFELLPEAIQKVVLEHLKKDEFAKAKQIYDEWLSKQQAKVKAPPSPQNE